MFMICVAIIINYLLYVVLTVMDMTVMVEEKRSRVTMWVSALLLPLVFISSIIDIGSCY